MHRRLIYKDNITNYRRYKVSRNVETVMKRVEVNYECTKVAGVPDWLARPPAGCWGSAGAACAGSPRARRRARAGRRAGRAGRRARRAPAPAGRRGTARPTAGTAPRAPTRSPAGTPRPLLNIKGRSVVTLVFHLAPVLVHNRPSVGSYQCSASRQTVSISAIKRPWYRHAYDWCSHWTRSCVFL